MKLYNNIDDVVNLRKGMAMILQEGIDKVSRGESRDFFKRALKRISTYEGYDVKVNCSNVLKIDGKHYGNHDGTILITENGVRMFAIYKDRVDGKTKLDVNPLDLVATRMSRSDIERMYNN